MYKWLNVKVNKINTILDSSQYGKYFENKRDVMKFKFLFEQF